jgi:cytochrome c-type biogenesis protein CcmH
VSRTSSLKRWPGWVLLVFVVVGSLAYGTTRDAGAQTPEERVEEIAKRLACPVCDGESVYESANPASAAIRQEIKSQVAAGTASDDDIVAYIVQQFGAKTQLVPKATGFESLVWVLPAVAFVCAGVGLFFAFRRWRTNIDTVPDDADRALVEEALSRVAAEPEPPGDDAPPGEPEPPGEPDES